MSEYACEQHPHNNQCGLCPKCTFEEYQKYRDLYHEALEALQLVKQARSMTGRANTMVNRLVNENHRLPEETDD